jgi:TonB-dependent SusC/RagA subfamily outer membrane receptor
MKRQCLFLIATLIAVVACGPSKDTTPGDPTLKQSLDEKNRVSISLLNRIRRLPGITIRNGVPVFTKNSSDISSGVPIEPLYVLDGYVMGNSFRAVDELVDNINIQKIEALSDTEAAFYGSRAANGVILISSYK